MRRTLRPAHALGLLAVLGAMPAAESGAQDRFVIHPFISMTGVHDSDVFSTAGSPRSDVVMRLAPGADATYDTPAAAIAARYQIDFERFTRYPELTTMNARQHATIALAYRTTPLVAFAAGGEFLTTRTPEDLTRMTGLTVTRARARRSTAHASVSRQFSAVTSGTLGFSFADDRLGRSFATQTHAADARLARRLSRQTVVRGAYRVDAFGFTTGGGRRRVASHSVSIGGSREIAPRIRASFDIGPRLTGRALRPEVAASVTVDRAAASLRVSYMQTQTTIIGLAGAADVRRVGVTLGRTFARSLDVQVAPACFRTALGGSKATVYALAINVTRPLSARLALDVAVHGSLQHGNVYPGATHQAFPRHSVAVRLLARPAATPAHR